MDGPDKTAKEVIDKMAKDSRAILPKPPLGLIPRWAWALDTRRARIYEIVNAISRYINDDPPKLVPAEWIDELRDLTVDPPPLRDQPPTKGDSKW